MLHGLGVDVLEISRVERELQRDAEEFEQEIFTAGEIAACRGERRPALGFALRFAGKEAVAKALGLDGVLGTCWRWIEILPGAPAGGSDGTAGVLLHGPLAGFARRRGFAGVHLSLTHTRSLVAASAAVEVGAGFCSSEVSP